MESAALGAGLIGSHLTQTFALMQVGVFQIATVLQAQHGLLPLHPPHGAPPVRRQDVGRADGRFLRLVDHAVIALDRWPVSFGHTAKSTIRRFRFGRGQECAAEGLELLLDMLDPPGGTGLIARLFQHRFAETVV